MLTIQFKSYVLFHLFSLPNDMIHLQQLLFGIFR